MKTPQAVAIYARISSDPSGTALGVERQLQDCRRLARERGWTVAAEYVDNDLSAYKASTARPAYRQMLADLEAGVRDAVIVYNMDRLTRQPIQLEEFAALCERAGVRQVATVTADVDLGTDDGLFMARFSLRSLPRSPGDGLSGSGASISSWPSRACPTVGTTARSGTPRITSQWWSPKRRRSGRWSLACWLGSRCGRWPRCLVIGSVEARN